MPRLYVGNLAYSVTKGDLEALFAQAGTVENAAVITDKFSGQSKGFGFVEMTDASAANNAIQSLNDTEFQGRRIKVAEARAAERGPGGGAGRSGGGRRSDSGNRRW